jgi:hypothetical protein
MGEVPGSGNPLRRDLSAFSAEFLRLIAAVVAAAVSAAVVP